MEYVSKNGTGTGEIGIDIDTVDGIPLGDSFLNLPQPAGIFIYSLCLLCLNSFLKGTYGTKISIKAEPDPDCDPTQGPCEQWLPGEYKVSMGMSYFSTLSLFFKTFFFFAAICNGECGSKHPHSKIYDIGRTNFTITN